MKAFFPHSATTDGVTVRVSVSFLPDQSEVDKARWFWAYHVRIENNRDMSIQLLTRHWKITDGRGGQHHVDGEGVIGEQPILKPGASHDYVSGCPLNTPTGHMDGLFKMITDDEQVLDIVIPRFPLVAPAIAE